MKSRTLYLFVTLFGCLSITAMWSWTKDNPEILSHEDKFVPLNDSRPTKVLIIAYFRTGSSFTGELLQQKEGTFYAFEPLIVLFNSYSKKYGELVLFDGTKWPGILDGLYQGISDILTALLDCDCERVDEKSLFAFADKSKILNSSAQCNRKHGFSHEMFLKFCIPDLRAACKKAPVRVIKSIRTPMKLVPELLKRQPSLKTIHVLRDPRGHLHSWIKFTGSSGNQTELIINTCTRIGEDLKDRSTLEKQFPGSFMEVIYETLSQKPMDVVQEIYSWLGIELGQNLIASVKNITQNSKDGGVMETNRKNSSLTAYSWVNEVQYSFIQTVNTHCRDILLHGEFPLLNSEEEFKKFQVLHRHAL